MIVLLDAAWYACSSVGDDETKEDCRTGVLMELPLRSINPRFSRVVVSSEEDAMMRLELPQLLRGVIREPWRCAVSAWTPFVEASTSVIAATADTVDTLSILSNIALTVVSSVCVCWEERGRGQTLYPYYEVFFMMSEKK